MRNAFATILFFVLALQLVAAQPYQSQKGFFTVDQIRGCAPLTVTISAPSCDGTVACDVFYEGQGGQSESVFLTNSHTYTTPGIYTISLLRGPEFDNIQVEVFASTTPQFQIVSCGGNKLSVSVPATPYDRYAIDFGDGTSSTIPSSATTQYTYAAPGQRTLTVQGRMNNAANNCASASQTVNVVATLPTPVITQLTVVDDTRIALAFNGSPFIQYRVEMATNSGTNFQQIRTLINTTVDTVKNLRTSDNTYCFRISAFDPCNNVILASNIICSANVSVSVANNVNNVNWVRQTSTTLISREELLITPTGGGTSGTISNASNPYPDVDVVCGTEYCYVVTLVYENNSRSTSLPACGTAISTDEPEQIQNISAVVVDNGVELEWYPEPNVTPDLFSLFIFDGNADGELYLQTANTNAFDSLYTPETNSCYAVSLEDVCGNTNTAGRHACPISLTASLSKSNDVLLVWTGYDGWSEGVGLYTLEKYDKDGNMLETLEIGTDTTYTDNAVDLSNQVYQYRVVATAVSPDPGPSVSNMVTITKDPNLFYPGSFTPNGDGLNDMFNVYGQYISGFEMDIFNRWGELMFTTTDLEQGWDGSYGGSAMPEGTYTFVAKITDFAGRDFLKSGSILLLQKNK